MDADISYIRRHDNQNGMKEKEHTLHILEGRKQLMSYMRGKEKHSVKIRAIVS